MVVLIGVGLVVNIQSPATNRFKNQSISNKRGACVQYCTNLHITYFSMYQVALLSNEKSFTVESYKEIHEITPKSWP